MTLKITKSPSKLNLQTNLPGNFPKIDDAKHMRA